MTEWLTDTLLATSLLMAFVLLVREPVRFRFGPRAAYGLWLIPVLRLIVPPLTWTVERSVPAAAAKGAALTRIAETSEAVASDPTLAIAVGGWEGLAAPIWLAGAAAMLLTGLAIYRRQRGNVLAGCEAIGKVGRVRIVSSAAASGPIAFGIFDRVVALPRDFEERYAPDEQRLAIAHELAHHRAGDLAVNLGAFALLCLQWFNPLAWISHAAFRFDQEAACDARVLDETDGPGRASYAQAIAKAASGRALLFAGALDRPGTLNRRIRSMLTSQSSGRRVAGTALIAIAATIALPLTASWATRYVDVPQAAKPAGEHRADAPARSAGPGDRSKLSEGAAAMAEPRETGAIDRSPPDLHGVSLGQLDVAFFDDDTIWFEGKRVRLEELSARERSRLRATLLASQKDLARERAGLPRELAQMRREMERARDGEIKRDYLRDRKDLERDLAEVDAEADELRAGGEDPEKVKAEIRASLRELEATDIDAEIRQALVDADPERRTAELAKDEAQMARMLAKLDRLDRR